MKILVTCGYNYSKHTIALLHLLQQEQLAVDRCIIVSIFSFKRIRMYYRQLDKREFFKKLRDRILANYTQQEVSDEMVPINNLISELGIATTKVSDFCFQNNIPFKFVSSLNSPQALKFTEYPDLGVYSGGGILGKKFLERFSIGVLNCHAAKLPEIRGYNTGEWSILLGIPKMNTIHFMVRALDMGPILTYNTHDYSSCITIDQMRGLGIRNAVYDLVRAAKTVSANEYKTTVQQKSDGKQYFAMHPILKAIVNKKLASNSDD